MVVSHGLALLLSLQTLKTDAAWTILQPRLSL